ncbi:MAG: aminotransferase class V-fold PLP-dependent enzyme [Pseudomonadales bacterium]|nr:aminotransferase class V-fold PLP-dependent enzyme [Pseudomonadales bacterium]NRA17235.1 aminotransferase class V-fold PLP-dependent enzyme [Oceanospirillaceae bacterium]
MTISIQTIRQGVIGDGMLFDTAFGSKPMIYADYTASGRSLSFIEETITKNVLPFYANTHSETSFTGKQSTKFREQARAAIHQALHTTASHKVIFAGSGATAAINKLIDMLNLRLPAELNAQYQFEAQIKEQDRPVVFIGPYEHHSNELPWRESIVTLVSIPLDNQGQIDAAYLEQQLQKYSARPKLIGSFSAASNVTGVKTDVAKISAILKQYGAMSCWDYAAAAPYVGIDMARDQLDAVFISTHKFIGGPGTPGLLVVNGDWLSNSVPAVPGGGTVVYVSPESHTFINDIERREEGGTPSIVESIRAGLVFNLQQQVGTEKIEQLEHNYIQSAMQSLSQLPNFQILGGTSQPRLSILSFNIKHKDSVLHYGFVVALLNDIFGIQARGGCSCAGPYGHELLDLSMLESTAIEGELHRGNMVLRPGWTRLNFNYFIDQQTFDYLIGALKLVAEHGWRLLASYQFNQSSGTWEYVGGQQSNTLTLQDLLDFAVAGVDSPEHQSVTSDQLSDYLTQGLEILLAAKANPDVKPLELSASAEELRWFALPE